MKHLIISIAMLFASIIAHAQSSETIDHLIRRIDSLGVVANVAYSYYGMHTKKVSFSKTVFVQYDDNGNLVPEQGYKELEAHQIICETLKGMTDMAQESYMWEKHTQLADSVKYSFTFQDEETLLYEYYVKKSRPEEVKYTNGRGFGLMHLNYFCQLDSVIGKTEYINTNEYKQLLQPILKQKGIEAHPIYLSHDTTFSHLIDEAAVNSFARQPLRKDMMFYEGIFPIQPASETKGTIYTMRSKEQADSVLKQIVDATQDYLEKHPTYGYNLHINRTYDDNSLREVFSSFSQTIPYLSFQVNTYYAQGIYCICIFDTKGELWLPKDFLLLKSWQNGKKKYNKRMKGIDEKELLKPASVNKHTTYYQVVEPEDAEPKVSSSKKVDVDVKTKVVQ